MENWKKNILIILIALICVCAFVLGFCIGEMQTNKNIIKLHEVALEEEVAIYYTSEQEMLLWEFKGRFSGVPVGVYLNNTVYIDMRYRNRAKLLAHELGHHFAIKYENDYSEERADEIGSELLRR